MPPPPASAFAFSDWSCDLNEQRLHGDEIWYPKYQPQFHGSPLEGRQVYPLVLKTSQSMPGSSKVAKAFDTRTWNVYAAEYYNDSNSLLLAKETEILRHAKFLKAVN